MEVVFGYLCSPMHVKLCVSETEDFHVTSFSVLDIRNGEQRKLLAYKTTVENIRILFNNISCLQIALF